MSKEVPTALQRAVGFLARREHSRLELKQKLRSRDYSDQEIEQALERLCQDRLQSDERFAESYVQSRIQRGHGPFKIAMELQQRGVDEALIDLALDQAGQDWFALAREVAARKYGEMPARDFAERTRRSRFLQQRGFTAEQIREALDTPAG